MKNRSPYQNMKFDLIVVGAGPAGSMAAMAAAKAGLKTYEDRWRRSLDAQLSRDYKLTEIFTKLTDQDMNSVLHIRESQDTSQMDLEGLVKPLSLGLTPDCSGR